MEEEAKSASTSELPGTPASASWALLLVNWMPLLQHYTSLTATFLKFKAIDQFASRPNAGCGIHLVEEVGEICA